MSWTIRGKIHRPGPSIWDITPTKGIIEELGTDGRMLRVVSPSMVNHKIKMGWPNATIETVNMVRQIYYNDELFEVTTDEETTDYGQFVTNYTPLNSILCRVDSMSLPRKQSKNGLLYDLSNIDLLPQWAITSVKRARLLPLATSPYLSIESGDDISISFATGYTIIEYTDAVADGEAIGVYPVYSTYSGSIPIPEVITSTNPVTWTALTANGGLQYLGLIIDRNYIKVRGTFAAIVGLGYLKELRLAKYQLTRVY
jgi:hypothetical protein